MAKADAPVEEAVPTGGDVDTGLLSKEHHKGEVGPPILAGYWVRLGNHKSVPAEAVGKIASVVSSPWQPVPWTSFQDQPIGGLTFDKKADFVVKLRDETDGIITVPAAAISEFAESRAALTNFA